MNSFASLCIVSYKRPELLRQCLDTLLATIDYSCEIIVNCDGNDTAQDVALEYYKQKKISKIILNNGDNRGVGRSFQNCLGLAEGEYIFKIDSDIIFRPQWLSRAVGVLESHPEIGTVGLFDYHRQDPNDERFKPENNVLEERMFPPTSVYIEYKIVKDFVSSIYGFRKKDLYAYSADGMIYEKFDSIPDDGLHASLGAMALLDVVDNKAFGFGSVYVTIKPDGTAFKTQTFGLPFLVKNS